MDYTKYMKTSRSGLFIPDWNKSYRRTLLDNLFEVWTYPITDFDFLKLKLGYSNAVKHKYYQVFLTDKDRIVLDLLSNTDPEYLMENKQFMKEFETSYRFLKSLGLDERYY